MSGRSHYQVRENRFHDSYFSLKEHEYRPVSVTTEIVDTDWEEEELVGGIEDDNANSPRVSLNSVRKTTYIHFLSSPLLTCVLDWPTKCHNAIIIRRGIHAQVEPDSRGVSLRLQLVETSGGTERATSVPVIHSVVPVFRLSGHSFLVANNTQDGQTVRCRTSAAFPS
jgi:hypothetical protein